jgi:hypothetical protein
MCPRNFREAVGSGWRKLSLLLPLPLPLLLLLLLPLLPPLLLPLLLLLLLLLQGVTMTSRDDD